MATGWTGYNCPKSSPVACTKIELPRVIRRSCYTSEMDHKGRLKRLETLLDSTSVDALLITHLPNIRYLCGFTGTSGVLAILETSAIFFTDGRYSQQARAEVKGSRVVIARKPPLAAAAEWLIENNNKIRRKKPIRLGIESE